MDETPIPRIQDWEGHLIVNGIRLELEEAEDAHAYDSPASKVILLTSAAEVLLSFNSQLSVRYFASISNTLDLQPSSSNFHPQI